MRKLILIAAMLAMALAVAAPAFAQDVITITNNEQEQELNQDQNQESGDVTTGGATATGGDKSIVQQSAALLNQINTGNQGVQQANQAQISGDVSGDGDAFQVQDQSNEADQSISFDASQEQFSSQEVFQANDNVVFFFHPFFFHAF